MASGSSGVRVSVELKGIAWTRFQERLANMAVSANAMARTRFIIGSRLAYGSHWIEEGWRDDPILGRVDINYRQPAGAHFMRDAAQTFRANVRKASRSNVVGGVFNVNVMQQWGESIAQEMRDILDREVYSQPVATNYAGVPKWVRTQKLYKSIRVYRA